MAAAAAASAHKYQVTKETTKVTHLDDLSSIEIREELERQIAAHGLRNGAPAPARQSATRDAAQKLKLSDESDRKELAFELDRLLTQQQGKKSGAGYYHIRLWKRPHPHRPSRHVQTRRRRRRRPSYVRRAGSGPVIHEDDQHLLDLVGSILFRHTTIGKLPSSNRWASERAGVFVTAYHRWPPISEHVWCCLSNGEYDGRQTVEQNARESATLCRDTDPRRGQADIPPLRTYWQVDVLRPRTEWKQVNDPATEMNRTDQHSWYLSLQSEGSAAAAALYLPSVWDERRDWTPQNLILSLAEKADRHRPSAFSTLQELTTQYPQWRLFRVPTLNLHPNPPSPLSRMRKSGGRTNVDMVMSILLTRAWSFYMDFASSPAQAQLAYLMVPGQPVQYDNEGVWVRTYADLSTAYRLAQRLSPKHQLWLQPYLDHVAAFARAHKQDDDPAARLSFGLQTDQLKLDELNQLAEHLWTKKVYVSADDRSFRSPQALLALAEFQTFLNHNFVPWLEFLEAYLPLHTKDPLNQNQGWAHQAVHEHGAFAAHWILRALVAGRRAWPTTPSQLEAIRVFLDQTAVPVCVEACQNGDSVTIQSCALTALATYPGPTWLRQQSWFEPLLQRWSEWQSKWQSEAHGGFRYYPHQPWYRTDVTSHVVESLLLVSVASVSSVASGSSVSNIPTIQASQAGHNEAHRRRSPSGVPIYDYVIVNMFPHDTQAFTQGLTFLDGALIESTGLEHQSTLRRVELETGNILHKIDIPAFAEGITHLNGKIYQLTWKSEKGFIYDAKSLIKIGEFPYKGEGWGLTHDTTSLIASDGTDQLRFLDPTTFVVKRTMLVTDGGQPVTKLNELEYVNGEIYANIWQQPCIARIDPTSGRVTGWIDLAGLLKAMSKTSQQKESVLNGIAYDAKGDRMFVTGKLWPHVFEIKLC